MATYKAADVERLRRMLEPGDVLLFTTNRPVGRLIRAAETGCPVNHAAFVVNTRGEDRDGCPGVLVATWDCSAHSLASGAIGTYDLDQLASGESNVEGIHVMRPNVDDPQPYVANALKMSSRGSSWQFNAAGLVAVCLGLLSRDPRRIANVARTAWRCIIGSHPAPKLSVPSPLRMRPERVQLITCSEFVYRCFANAGGNALGPVSDRPSRQRPNEHQIPSIALGEPGWLFVVRTILPQVKPGLRILLDPASTAWVTPGWLYRCPQLDLVACWPRGTAIEARNGERCQQVQAV